MYRQYEDPYSLETELKSLKEYYIQLMDIAERKGLLAPEWDMASDICQEIMDLKETIEELKERKNFAIQDMEAEEYGYSY